jgi:hypothetical protein
MRFSATSILALPLLAAAAHQETPLEQAKAQAQSWAKFLSNWVPKIPSPNAPHTPPAAAAKAGGKVVNVLTLNDWEDTVKASIKPGATATSAPEEWWIFLTGGNKTCFGHCGVVEKAFNETAALWSLDPTAPHLGYINCDLQPVLCNSWAAGPPTLWFMDVRPRPALNDLRIMGLNATSTTVKTFTDLRSTQSYKSKDLYEGYFHPLDGMFAQLGVAKYVGYFFWCFTIIPSWLFMILVSLASRSIM